MNRNDQIYQLEKDWNENPRWENTKRPYTAKDVINLRGQLNVEYFITSQIVVNNKGIMIIALSLWCTQCFFPEKFICNIIYLYYFYKPN